VGRCLNGASAVARDILARLSVPPRIVALPRAHGGRSANRICLPLALTILWIASLLPASVHILVYISLYILIYSEALGIDVQYMPRAHCVIRFDFRGCSGFFHCIVCGVRRGR
jgi:hypothetical protein